MTREEALKEILRRAHREHGTCVLTLRRIEREVAEMRRHVDAHAADPGDQAHAGYLAGVADMVELVEEALFEIFNVRPADRQAPADHLPRPAGMPRPLSGGRAGGPEG